ncbi:hypothetical protein J4218_06860 [Candidatus Pacearchaeota archaeon]|nr:hypothetical protein [Candidatus Pacearchaeota archaeon]
MEQKYVLGIVLLITAVIGVSMVSAFGFGNGLMKQDITDEDRTLMQEKHEQMKSAIENKDYATWKTLMEEQIAKMQSQITEDNFNKIVENHVKMQDFRNSVESLENQYGMKGQGCGMGKGKMQALD